MHTKMHFSKKHAATRDHLGNKRCNRPTMRLMLNAPVHDARGQPDRADVRTHEKRLKARIPTCVKGPDRNRDPTAQSILLRQQTAHRPHVNLREDRDDRERVETPHVSLNESRLLKRGRRSKNPRQAIMNAWHMAWQAKGCAAMRDRTDKELYKYLKTRERRKHPRRWPWIVLVVVILVALYLLSRVRIIWIWG